MTGNTGWTPSSGRARGKGWEAKLLKALGKAERMAEGVVAEVRGM